MKQKSLPLAIGLNFIVAGLGYAYMGKWITAVFAFFIVLSIYLTFGLFALFFVWIIMNAIMIIDMIILSGKHQKKFIAATTKKCPFCAELIQREALICKSCRMNVEGLC